MPGYSRLDPAAKVHAGAKADPGAGADPGAWAVAGGWAAAVRRHWLAIALLAAGLVLRVLAETAYRPALFYIDTTRYLYNSGGNDPSGYTGMLKAVLLAGNLDAVALVQHLLGLGMAVVIYVLLLRRGAARWLAALAIAPVLLDGYELQNEQTIMPGTLFQALIVAGLAILLWRPELTWRRVAAAGVLLGASATVAQVGEAMIAPAVIFVLAAGGGWRRVAGRGGLICAAFALPILAYCTGSYLITGGFFLSHTGVTSFYGRTAAAADCATIRLPAAERGLCPAPAQQAQGPDWLEYNAASPVRPYYADIPRAVADRELADFNHQVLFQQPQRVLGAYGRDLLKLFAVTRHTSPGDTPISRWQFQSSFPYYTSHATRAFDDAAARRFGGGQPATWRPVAAFLRSYQRGGGYTPGPLLALLVLTGVAGSVAAARRRASHRTRQLALACLLFTTSAGALLLVSDLFEFSWRYQLPALVTLVPGGALGIAALISAARERRATGPAPEPAVAPSA
jgi:hypothetical protein